MMTESKAGYTKGARKNQLDTMFKALQAKALKLQQQTSALHAQQQDLTGKEGTITKQKAITMKQLQVLQSQQDKLNKLMEEGNTLNAIVHDNTLQMNAAYLRYIVWFGAAVTIGLVAIHRATK